MSDAALPQAHDQLPRPEDGATPASATTVAPAQPTPRRKRRWCKAEDEALRRGVAQHGAAFLASAQLWGKTLEGRSLRSIVTRCAPPTFDSALLADRAGRYIQLSKIRIGGESPEEAARRAEEGELAWLHRRLLGALDRSEPSSAVLLLRHIAATTWSQCPDSPEEVQVRATLARLATDGRWPAVAAAVQELLADLPPQPPSPAGNAPAPETATART